MTTTGELATETQRSTRSVRHLVVDVALGTLMIALCGLVFLATPGPWLCPASNPTPFPCNQGDRDLIALIDLSTYRRIPWENNVPFFLVTFLDPDTKKPICACPRGTLAKVIDAAQAQGYQCLAGAEYEVNN